jgi:hypothetical protein
MAEQQTIVWQASARARLAAIAVSAVLLVLSARVLYVYGFLALIGVLLVLGVVGQTYWQLLRPRLTAGPDGVVVLSGWAPQTLAWSDIRRVEPRRSGFVIFTTDGREVVSRVPAQNKTAADEPTEADAAAAYLAQRAAWERKPSGPAPRYEYVAARKPAARPAK